MIRFARGTAAFVATAIVATVSLLVATAVPGGAEPLPDGRLAPMEFPARLGSLLEGIDLSTLDLTPGTGDPADLVSLFKFADSGEPGLDAELETATDMFIGHLTAAIDQAIDRDVFELATLSPDTTAIVNGLAASDFEAVLLTISSELNSPDGRDHVRRTLQIVSHYVHLTEADLRLETGNSSPLTMFALAAALDGQDIIAIIAVAAGIFLLAGCIAAGPACNRLHTRTTNQDPRWSCRPRLRPATGPTGARE